MRPFFFAVAMLIAVSSAFATLATDVEALTGARTKVVWIEEHTPGSGTPADWDAWGNGYSLKGFDTRGSGEITTIVPGPAVVQNPQFTPDGNQLIYSDFLGTKKIWMINWDGTGKKELVGGYGLSLWKDPVTKYVWLYFSQYAITDEIGVRRARLDDLSIVELVWNKTPINARFRMSRDGRYSAAEAPWPTLSVQDLQGGTWTKFADGCNPQIAPDNSYRVMNFESGNHQDIAMWGPKGAGPKKLINVEFAGSGKQAWAPRFSTSKAEIITVSAPLSGATDIYIAKFNATFTGITSNVKITTENGRQKTYAMAWIPEGTASSSSSKVPLIARAAPVLKGLQLRLPGSGVYAIDIFTPRGARAGSFQFKAPGAFDLSHAGLANGLYQIRVRAGADIFWLKAPVVR